MSVSTRYSTDRNDEGRVKSDDVGIDRKGRIVAFVGGGGKTSLLMACAREHAEAAREAKGRATFLLMTTTTKMLMPEVSKECDVVIIGTDLQDVVNKIASFVLKRVRENVSGRVFLASEALTETYRGRVKVRGIDPRWPAYIMERCPQITLALVEADGARHRPLKAPASHEPVVPSMCDVVVGVAGIDCVGKRLSDDAVFRPNEIAKITHTRVDVDVIRNCDVANILVHRGHWRIPRRTRAAYVVCINKLDDTIELSSDASEILKHISLRAKKEDVSCVLFTGRNTDVGKTVVVRRCGREELEGIAARALFKSPQLLEAMAMRHDEVTIAENARKSPLASYRTICDDECRTPEACSAFTGMQCLIT